MLRERFDSIFRRNLMEMPTPLEDKKRNKKRIVKFKNRRGAAFGGTLSSQLAEENAQLK